MRYFEEIVSARAAEIVTKWIDFFVLHKPIKPERITNVRQALPLVLRCLFNWQQSVTSWLPAFAWRASNCLLLTAR